MRSPKDFFKPLAVGAPAPLHEIPVRPSRMIHFFPASNATLPGADNRHVVGAAHVHLADQPEVLSDVLAWAEPFGSSRASTTPARAAR